MGILPVFQYSTQYGGGQYRYGMCCAAGAHLRRNISGDWRVESGEQRVPNEVNVMLAKAGIQHNNKLRSSEHIA